MKIDVYHFASSKVILESKIKRSLLVCGFYFYRLVCIYTGLKTVKGLKI